ncbi:hypothetical protein BP6252_10861 [Coleophoma cylindrospora]|uniref:Uncharacterized protein n=1 Tax=Coleophoma cylindrospora TaxID=1849047 RepID=A0A3D8QNB5_9HELO|nr:hypothetical protein BP6252_10861 [Coleophoma cylindrospora]
MRSPWLLVLVVATGGLAGHTNQNTSSFKKGKVPVGRFTITLNDDQLPDPQINRTLFNNLWTLYEKYAEVWLAMPLPLSPSDEAINITATAKGALPSDEFQEYSDNLLSMANVSFTNNKAFLTANGCTNYLAKDDLYCDPDNTAYDLVTDAPYTLIRNDPNSTAIYMDDWFWDLGYEYLLAVYNATVLTQVFNQAALMGVGKTVSCSENINIVLSTKNEWAKAGSSAATTLMALLPTFLAFGSLYVPQSSEVFSTSALVGLGSSVYSLGLPTKSMSAIPGRQKLSLATFGLAALAVIASYATKKDRKDDDPNTAEIPAPSLEELREWSTPRKYGAVHSGMEEAKHSFSLIHSAVSDWESRWHWWHLPAILVTAAQIVMFVLAIAPLLVDVGAPRFLFACNANWTGRYLGISAAANAVFRFVMWEMGYHERVKVYALSKYAREKLESIVDSAENKDARLDHSVENELPPLLPPLLTRIQHGFNSSLSRTVLRKSKTFQKYNKHQSHVYAAHLGDQQHLTQMLAKLPRRWKNQCKYIWNNPKSTLKSGFQFKSQKRPHQNPSARRWRPLVILIHLGIEGRSNAMTLLTGFVESALLLVLTFFFASQWGGNLVITGFALSLLLIFISAGRVLGFLYVALSAKVWGLHVINCSSHEEILGSLRIVCAMKDVLVTVNGASYFNGYRLRGFNGYEDWREDYEKGRFDLDDASTGVPKTVRESSDGLSYPSSRGDHGAQGAQDDVIIKGPQMRASTMPIARSDLSHEDLSRRETFPEGRNRGASIPSD